MRRLGLACLFLLVTTSAQAQIVIRPALNVIEVCWSDVGEVCKYPDISVAATGTKNTINNGWRDSTYGAVNITTTGYGPYFIPKRAVTNGTQRAALINEVKALAGTDAWVTDGLPTAWIVPSGLGNSLLLNNGIWLVGGYGKSDHEYGHLMGFIAHAHAQNYNGSTATLIDAAPGDLMGQGGIGTNIKNRMTGGWVNPNQLVNGDVLGSFTISQSLIQNPTLPIGVSICSGMYYVEYRFEKVNLLRRNALQDLNDTATVDYYLDAGQSYHILYVVNGFTVCDVTVKTESITYRQQAVISVN